ncbi:hypothetical protein A2331_03875 [Candidatus Falkowbacteria bacterium RIFOXYB2_FULL_34_18]|uniref:(d)CMP kinase n=1 Tax=Candidatus Falkowbacteria bacterium RIFOXYD2_FULL_34_120 TaxID=1798007 RepID=A0A1F5TPR1_9BACT|nr:MAG: hypothetical protein A2331_03875 [Candidatus Falkowbacteria bacterium RIFOXYB2_FULL_34_18]OGF29091.1 MAG: hypothetical protein A2500_03200 [Candidatus Falkowbacteria bacterium RIFOXYC12_FULL_34_55]OGF36174.1 MAG: hypothetical protein A2466_04730 [Candidatus Falkowbacteria bacterium RIFOXYC2_FULL_34_220]OGF38601.1 MAG: hypothetical protein A2515_02090 [Candidatus Falkowbacteria bacterium RIFOXYD12_FULL_34_57]OGF40784.1 MAG: hypothetical protein A2531_06735 [Candidatus Falkowbacteria bact
MIISISGTAGSGKSTVAKGLAKKLKFKHYSMGDLQREVAEEMGVSIVELGELEKTDPSIDRMIDKKQRELGKKEDNFVIDAWLAPFFIPHAIKFFLDADIGERAKRRVVAKRTTESYQRQEDAERAIAQRENTNRERWIKFYGFDFREKKNYDYIIDTTNSNVREVLKKVNELLKK